MVSVQHFGIKQKILAVLVAVLALTTALAALLASYFTNRQNEQAAFEDLERALITWQNDLQGSTTRLRAVALDAVSDAVVLNQLAEIVTLELNLDEPAKLREASEAARTLGYAKSVSLNRMHLVLRTGGFTSIGVYADGQLSHYVSASQAGMRLRRAEGDSVWVQSSADAAGNLPFHRWPAWDEASPPHVLSALPTRPNGASILFDFAVPQYTSIQFVIPVHGVVEELATDVVADWRTRYVSELAVAEVRDGRERAASNARGSIVAMVVFQKFIDQAALEQVAAKTGKQPALFSPESAHRQLLDGNSRITTDLWDVQTVQTALAEGAKQRTVTTRHGSFYQAFLPWQFEGEPRLILGLASSRASTLHNIRQTVIAILTVAGLVLLLSIGLGMFWMNRFMNPILALTAAAKKMRIDRRQTGAEETHRTSGEMLHRIAIDAPDEVGDLAEAFNAMIAELRESFETLEQRVQDRTAELRQQTRYLRTLIDTLPLLVWLKDTESRYLAANQATAKACGRSLEQIVGRVDQELWPRELAEAYRKDDREVMRTGERKTVEERLADVNGAIWIETYKAPVFDEDGTVLGTVGAARDVSERKAAEAAREAALAEAERLANLRTEFLAQMSHELRTPLNAILGYAQILQRDEQLTDRQARGLATIQESGHHLLALIDDILDLSRIGASKLELYPADIDLTSFMRTVCDIIRVKADEKNLLFSYEGSPALPSAVRVDDKRLRQVLLNLLGNAVKFTDHGDVMLRVRRVAVHSSDRPQTARLRFEIEDSGIGMTSAQVQRIFHPFEQVADVKRRRGGAGLGLAISRQLVRLMGGDIHVRSEAGKGSVFSFELELQVAESHTEASLEHRFVTGYEGMRRTILIVDDVVQSRMMLMDFLTTLGFEVVGASNGEEAIEQALCVRPDLIAMDITMPIMDGLEATRRIRSKVELAQVPILIASASASSGDEARSLGAGASAFIAKPINEERLLKMIGDLLSLEWIYSEGTESRELIERETTGTFVVPPQVEMDVLHRLALAGNMREIRDRANSLASANPRYAIFARRLQSLAERYRSEAVLAFVERYIAEAGEGGKSLDPSLPRQSL